jgi:uncharacterized membrane protein YeiB
MNRIKHSHAVSALLILTLCFTLAALGQTTTSALQNQKDSAKTATVEEMAKRVDSLQFIVVYNAELLRRNLDSKMILIYVMLGIIILASMLMYALLKQTQRQRKELEENLFHQLSVSVSDLEAKIKSVQAELAPPPKPPAKKAAPKKRKK